MSGAKWWVWSSHAHIARPATAADVARTLCGIAVPQAEPLKYLHEIAGQVHCAQCLRAALK